MVLDKKTENYLVYNGQTNTAYYLLKRKRSTQNFGSKACSKAVLGSDLWFGKDP